MYIYMCMAYVCIYIYIYIHTYTYIYIYIYIYVSYNAREQGEEVRNMHRRLQRPKGTLPRRQEPWYSIIYIYIYMLTI